MRLLVISLMPHHLRDGAVTGWGPTVRELDQLATRFERVRHVAPLYPEPAPASDLPYAARNVELVPVRPSGADGFWGKVDALRAAPAYVRAMLRELPEADMVHVRAPANIALLAMLVLSVRRTPAPRWFKYAGNWHPERRESPSYTIQRWWLGRRFHRGIVTISGEWPDQPRWVRTFYNPSLTDEDLERGARIADAKRIAAPVRLLYIGRVEPSKGAPRAIETVAKLRARGIDAKLELVGDGEERAAYERRAQQLGVDGDVAFLGWQPHTALPEIYARAHILLLPSASEGWPKVLSEGMAYGALPVAGAVGSIPQYLEALGVGAALPPYDVDAFADAIARYVRAPDTYAAEAARAARAARVFSFRHYLGEVDKMLAELGLAP